MVAEGGPEILADFRFLTLNEQKSRPFGEDSERCFDGCYFTAISPPLAGLFLRVAINPGAS